MDEQQIRQLIQAADQGDEQALGYIGQILQQQPEALEDLIALSQQLGANNLAQMLMQYANQGQQQQSQTPSMKLGAKINYIKSLRGQCPDGYEMKYFKKGGRFCKKCRKQQKKMGDGGKTPMNAVDSFRCGRKMKK